MEEIERPADHIVVIDHGKVLADETPAALYRRLPAQAALRVDLALPADAILLDQIRLQPGVIDIAGNDSSLEIGLRAVLGAFFGYLFGGLAVWRFRRDALKE